MRRKALLIASAFAENFTGLIFYPHNNWMPCHRDLLLLPPRSALANIVSIRPISAFIRVACHEIYKNDPFVSLATSLIGRRCGHMGPTVSRRQQISIIRLTVSTESLTFPLSKNSKEKREDTDEGELWRMEFLCGKLCRPIWIWFGWLIDGSDTKQTENILEADNGQSPRWKYFQRKQFKIVSDGCLIYWDNRRSPGKRAIINSYRPNSTSASFGWDRASLKYNGASS